MLRSLYLRNFRNFTEAILEFGPKINVFYGLNAQGKTNLLEAISLISTGRSFRTQHFSELISEGADFFFLEGVIVQDNIQQTIRLSYDGKLKQIECNSSVYPSFQSLLGLMPAVLFILPDIDLIMGSPAARRRFINLHLSQSDPLYFHHLKRFWRATKQRNTLLKADSMDGITGWEQEMAISAAYIYEKRKNLFIELNVDLSTISQSLLCEEIMTIFSPSQPTIGLIKESYLSQLQKNRSREKHLGMTLTGPHRDDFSLTIDQRSARIYGSEGQKRTAIAAIALAEWKRLERQTKTTPLFLVDDFELHLDTKRQELFQNALEGLGQVFITTPHENLAQSNVKCYKISQGNPELFSMSQLQNSTAAKNR